jgi:glycogen operon protein
VVVFNLPEALGGRDWLRLVDTNSPEDEDIEDAEPFKFGDHYEVTGRSLLLFLLRPARTPRRPMRDVSRLATPARAPR